MIKIIEISKSFGNIEALKNVSFEVKAGEIFGLLGPNGAGKSTIINILNTLLEPDSGEVHIDNINLRDYNNKCKMMIGVVPQEIALYEDLSAYDNLMFWGSLYNISRSNLKLNAKKALNMVGLTNRKNDSIKTYSGGMKRRVNIASSILHDPKILLMDEPTVGVDPQSRNHIFDVIEKLRDDSMTIIYTTHYMEEAERLCDRIAIIDMGRIIAAGTLEELKLSSKVKDLLILKISNLKDEIISQIKGSVSFKLDKDPDVLNIECADISKEISSIISNIQNTGAIIESIDTKTSDLESIFLKLTGKHLRD